MPTETIAVSQTSFTRSYTDDAVRADELALSCLRLGMKKDVPHDAIVSQTAESFLAQPAMFSPAAAVKRTTLVARGIVAELAQTAAHQRVECFVRSEMHMLIVYQRGDGVDGQAVMDVGPRRFAHDLARKMTFVPAGHAYRDWHSSRSGVSALYFFFDPAVLSREIEQNATSETPPARLLFEDALLWETALKIKAVIGARASGDWLYVEALGRVLTHEVLRSLQCSPAATPPARGGLAPWQRRATAVYIDEHLRERISLNKLAEIARLSPSHFCRAFKQSFGVPPHKYHMRRRIERAKELLAESGRSITDIGLEIGFGDTSSFSATFRKVTGLTASGYRRSAI